MILPPASDLRLAARAHAMARRYFPHHDNHQGEIGHVPRRAWRATNRGHSAWSWWGVEPALRLARKLYRLLPAAKRARAPWQFFLVMRRLLQAWEL